MFFVQLLKSWTKLLSKINLALNLVDFDKRCKYSSRHLGSSLTQVYEK